MREATGSGKTVDEAIEAACQQLGLPRDEVEIDVVSLPKRGFFGRSSDAKVRVYIVGEDDFSQQIIETPESSPETANKVKKVQKSIPQESQKEKTSKVEKDRGEPMLLLENEPEIEPDEKAAEKIAVAKEYVTSVVSALGVKEFTVTTKLSESGLYVSIDGDGLGVVIGKRGDALDALQLLTSLVVNHKDETFLRITIGSGDFREKRRKTLEELAQKVAIGVKKTGRKYTFEPMNALERRIIHFAISEIEGVFSKSFGEEPERKVIILSNSHRQNGGKFNSDRRGSRTPRGKEGFHGRRDEKRDRPQPYTPDPNAERAKPDDSALITGDLYTKIDI